MSEQLFIDLKSKHPDTPKDTIPILKKILFSAGYTGTMKVTMGPQIRGSSGSPRYSLASRNDAATSVEMYVKIDDNGSRYLFYFFPHNESVRVFHNKLKIAIERLNGEQPVNQPPSNIGQVLLELEDSEGRQPYWYILWPHNGVDHKINKYPGTNDIMYRDTNCKMSDDPAFQEANRVLDRMRIHWARSLKGEGTFRLEKYIGELGNAPKKFATLGDIMKEKDKQKKKSSKQNKPATSPLPFPTEVIPEPGRVPTPTYTIGPVPKIPTYLTGTCSEITSDPTMIKLIFDFLSQKISIVDDKRVISRIDITKILNDLNLGYKSDYILASLLSKNKGYLKRIKGKRGMLEVVYNDLLPTPIPSAPTPAAPTPEVTDTPPAPADLPQKLVELTSFVEGHKSMKKTLEKIDSDIEMLLDKIRSLNENKIEIQEKLQENMDSYKNALIKIKEMVEKDLSLM